MGLCVRVFATPDAMPAPASGHPTFALLSQVVLAGGACFSLPGVGSARERRSFLFPVVSWGSAFISTFSNHPSWMCRLLFVWPRHCHGSDASCSMIIFYLVDRILFRAPLSSA